MELKIDTKEKYQLLTPAGTTISAIIAAEIETICNKCLESPLKNMVLNLENVTDIDPTACQILTDLQQAFYDKSASFVMCCLSSKLETAFDELTASGVQPEDENGNPLSREDLSSPSGVKIIWLPKRFGEFSIEILEENSLNEFMIEAFSKS